MRAGGLGRRNRRPCAPRNRTHADAHRRPRSVGRLCPHRGGGRLAQAGADLHLGRPFVLSVPRREPARHARLGAPAPASGVPQGGHRTLLRQAGGRRADSDGLPNRGGIPETFAQEEDRALYQPLRAAAGDPFFGARGAVAGTRRAAYRLVAESRPLFRPAPEPLEVAAFAVVADLRGPLYPELRAAVSGSDARKCRGLRDAAPRTRRAEVRDTGGQRCRRAVPRGGGT